MTSGHTLTDAPVSDDEVIVWGTGTARTLRVYWALHELGVPFAVRPVRTRTSDMDAPAFLAISPGRKIPALVHGKLALTESGAIVAYLFDRFAPGSPAPEQRAEVARWSYFALTEIDATALYVMRRHRDLSEIYGEAPVALAAASGYFARQAGVVNEALRDGREFIAGGAFSAADVHLVSCCAWAQAYGLPLPPVLNAYQLRHRARAAYRAALRSNDSPD